MGVQKQEELSRRKGFSAGKTPRQTPWEMECQSAISSTRLERNTERFLPFTKKGPTNGYEQNTEGEWISRIPVPTTSTYEPHEWEEQDCRERTGLFPQKQRKKQTRGKRGGKQKKKKGVLGQGIFNLSDAVFTEDELKILDLGLKYAPEKGIDKFEVYIDLQKFIRKLKIKKHYALNHEAIPMTEADGFVHTKLRNNSIFNPKVPGEQCIGAFRRMVENDLAKMEKKKTKSKHIWNTIQALGKRKEVVIRPADKGGGLVILKKVDYEEEMNNLLRVENTYKKLKNNPKPQFTKSLRRLVKKGRETGILNKKETKYLVPESTKTPVIYYLPKIHKRLNKPPGRPIVSGVDSLFSRLGEYIDQFLKPLVVKGKSYLRDSTQLINEMKGITGIEHCLLATIDVNSLYTSISQKDGLKGVEKALHERSGLRLQQTQFILEGLQLAMESNYFWYQKDFYVQKKGVAMGAKYAPSVANLFMDMLEERYIYGISRPEIKFYRRYIDDIIIVWEGSSESFLDFLDELNQNDYGISFTGKSNPDVIDYLDLQILKQGGELFTKTFFKVTDRNGYIPTSSCHHPKWKENIPKGQLLRIRRNCRNIEDFRDQADALIKKFVDKGYKIDPLVKLKEEIQRLDRDSLLGKEQRNRKNSPDDIAFVTGFNNQYRSIEFIVRKYWPILRSDRTLGKILTKKPRFIYRKAPTLRNHLVHNVIDPPRSVKLFADMKGFYRCQKCLGCRVSKRQPKKKTSFKSRSGKEFEIRELVTCDTTHVTYVIECPCRLQYVGRTTRPLRVRIREHINNIKKGFPKHNLSRHFNEYHRRDPSGLIFYGIDTIKEQWRGGNKKILISQNETRWIHRLDSLVPRGLNVEIDLNCFLSNF